MMKKITALLCLLCTVCLLTGALAAPGDALLLTDDQKEELGIDDYSSPTLALVGDTLYALCGAYLCAWQPDMEAPEIVASNVVTDYYSTYEDAQADLGDDAQYIISMLISDGETLYGFNTLNGMLLPISIADGSVNYGTPIALDWSEVNDMLDDSGYVDIICAYFSGDAFYTLVRDNDDYENPILIAYSIETGEAATVDVEHVQSIAPYADGKLLLELYDYETAYDSETDEVANPTVAIYDPADGSVTEAGTFGSTDPSGLVYDADNDTLYYTTTSMLMAMPSLGEPTQVAYMPVDYTSDSPACILPGGLYAIYTWNGLIVRNTDPSYLPEISLTVYGGYIDDAANAFMTQYPNVPLVFDNNTYYDSASSLAQAMVSGDDSCDVYYLDISYQGLSTLMDKGYCLDLSTFESLTGELSQLYPFIQSAISKDGVFYAVPSYIYSNGFGIYTAAWEDEELTDRIPTSFMGLIDFFQWWLDEGMDEYPDLQLMDYAYDYRDMLFDMALELYVYQYQAEGEDLTLDTPLFREMLAAIDALDTDALNDTIPDEDDNDYDISYSDQISTYLFTSCAEWLTAYSYEEYTQPLLLPIEDGGSVYIPAQLTCAFINPNTDNPEMAAAYLQCVLDDMGDVQHVMMFPDDNDPIPNEYYEENLAAFENVLATAQASLETADPEDVKDIQSSIEFYQDYINNKESYRWNASAESIANYRTMAESAFVSTPSVFSYSGSDAYSEISTLIDRYNDGQITSDQFVTQAEQKIRMIQLEGQ